MVSLPLTREFVDGESRHTARRLPGALCDPNTGAELVDRSASAPEQVERALARAARVHEERSWSGLGVEGRATVLERLADHLAARAPQLALADSLNTGIPIGVTTPMTAGSADQVRAEIALLRAAGEIRRLPGKGRGGPVRLRRDPWGPALILAPWNAPTPVQVGRAAAALAAGCPVIIKPSEWAPSSSALLIEAAEAAEVPAGVLQVLQGDGVVGAHLAADPRVRAVSFTGGLETGRAIAGSAAGNFTRMQLELSGNNPVVVRCDADVAATAAALARGIGKLNGQWCEGPGKIFVDRRLHDELIDALVADLALLAVGSSLHEGTEFGPIAYSRHRDRLRAQIDLLVEAGGTAIAALDDLPTVGWFLSPTIVVGVRPGMAMDEVFGPVVTVHPVDGDEEALALAAAAPDGLAGYVFGDDIEAALRVGERLRAGEVRINGTSLLDLTAESHQSFWGSSGLGGHGYGDMFEFFRGSRIVGVDDPDAAI
jgi:phenylacetaldehyde dehydrogenase